MSLATGIKAFSVGLANEFKAFISKGNVMDLAVGVIIGGAFGDIVKSMVADIITPIIGLFGHGKLAFADFKLGPFAIGHFINTIVSFLILAAVVFFVLVKPMNKLMAKVRKPAAPAVPPSTPEDILLLREIRDALKNKP